MAMGNLLKILLRAKLIPMRDYHISDALFFILIFKNKDIRVQAWWTI